MADPAGSCAVVFIGSIWANILIALTLSILISAFAYMIGNLFKHENYIEFGKTELYNFIITSALVLSFTTLAMLAMEISCSQENGTSANLFQQALEKMNTILYGSVYATLKSLFQIMLEISVFSNMSLSFSGVKMMPLTGLKNFYTSLSVISFILESVFASLYLQAILLMVLKETAFTFIFPVGIFLRALPITRDAGTFLMVVSFSLFTIYPYIYVVSLNAYSLAHQEMQYDKIMSSLHHTPGFLYKSTKAIEDGTFYALTAFNYPSMRDMFIELGGHLFLALVVPAIAIVMTTAMTSSIIKFLKEVGA
ncbi:MAG: hypothetical protein N3G76_01810 [Candidatus Micrarchaeota archaeon]|nr:hypothetical protein [Candidatus Micrarchaeota archaeon]